jgi:hypothetical protein
MVVVERLKQVDVPDVRDITIQRTAIMTLQMPQSVLRIGLSVVRNNLVQFQSIRLIDLLIGLVSTSLIFSIIAIEHDSLIPSSSLTFLLLQLIH